MIDEYLGEQKRRSGIEMRRISGLVSKKVVVAFALAAIMIGTGAYVFALGGKSDAQSPKDIVIKQGPATSIQYRIYDMFQEPFGEWWANRLTFYGTDFIITDSTTDGYSTWLFLPDRAPATHYQGIIYAPYRYAIVAEDLTTIDVDHPEFMPVVGAPETGASASIDIYFQYIYTQWWEQYWIPTWGDDNTWIGDTWTGGGDGYDLGAVITATMNRAAALEWIGLPIEETDPVAWWATNEAAYQAAWTTWINDEGNDRLDIYCGYEWKYDINGGTMMDLQVGGTGDIILNIGHIALGYEILMTRWMTEINISEGLECFMEDFSMSVEYSASNADLTSDAVNQYSLHAVKANGTADGAAWVWEPAHIDYVVKMGHPSEYAPYRTMLYQSWNSGDVFFGQSVNYEQTPWWFNLSAESTLTIELPTTTSPGFMGVALLEEDYEALAAGDNTAFLAIMDNGDLGLGYWITGWPTDTQLDLAPMYDPFTRTLTINGPHNFSNFVNKPGTTYHGAPWIEFWIDNQGPTANAGPDQFDQVAGGDPVVFDGTGSADNVRIYNYTWTFMHMGSPMVLYGPNPEFVFGAKADYTVTLTVADSVGNTAQDQMVVHVTLDIPEFPTLVIPIAATLALVVVLKKRRR